MTCLQSLLFWHHSPGRVGQAWSHCLLCAEQGLLPGQQLPAIASTLCWAQAGCYIWPGRAVLLKPDAAALCGANSWSQWGRLVLANAALR